MWLHQSQAAYRSVASPKPHRNALRIPIKITKSVRLDRFKSLRLKDINLRDVNITKKVRSHAVATSASPI